MTQLLFDGPKVMTFCLMSKGGVPHFLDSQFWLSTAKYSAFNSLEGVTEYTRHEKLSTELSFFRHEMRCEQAKGVDLDK